MHSSWVQFLLYLIISFQLVCFISHLVPIILINYVNVLFSVWWKKIIFLWSLRFKSRLLELLQITSETKGERRSLKAVTSLAHFKLWNLLDLYPFKKKASNDENFQVFKFFNKYAHLFGEEFQNAGTFLSFTLGFQLHSWLEASRCSCLEQELLLFESRPKSLIYFPKFVLWCGNLNWFTVGHICS